MRIKIMTLLILMLLISSKIAFAQTPWSLTDEQRKSYLHFYSPIIFKEADESTKDAAGNPVTLGHDWITNWKFDNNQNFSNNRTNWDENKWKYIAGTNYPSWNIRPTLYTFILEFMENGKKSVVLLYHIYHALDAAHIHDWERIEIRLDNITGNPGTGEIVNYVVITEHSTHNSFKVPDPGNRVHFFNTANGKHLMVWQSEWSGSTGTHAGELALIDASEQNIRDMNNNVVGNCQVSPTNSSLCMARTHIPNDDSDGKKFHYVFVDESDLEAVNFWRAKPIHLGTASALSSGLSSSTLMNNAKRVRYELQDIADITPTQSTSKSTGSWGGNIFNLWMDDPIYSENFSTIQVNSGLQSYFNQVMDLTTVTERNGLISKDWMFGTYYWNDDKDFKTEALQPGSTFYTDRINANGRAISLNQYFWQHDFYVHFGGPGVNGSPGGKWLSEEWYKKENGGFDGRWIQLFKDAISVFKITGNVKRNNIGVSGVTVTLQEGTTYKNTVTNTYGNYVFSGMPAGDYKVSVHNPEQFKNVTVIKSNVAGINFTIN